MKYSIKKEVKIKASPERVWDALTDPEKLKLWLMETDFKPQVGARFQFRMEPQRNWDGIVNCEVLEIDAPRKLSYRWTGQALKDTLVTWTLEGDSSGTRLRLEHTGFQGMREIMVGFFHTMGWNSMIKKKLPKLLEDAQSSSAV